MSTPQELREAYLATVIHVEIEPGRWVVIDEAVRSFPTPLYVVTPWNPFSVVLSEEANSERMTGLMSDLAMTSATWFNATGSSPDGKWSEDSLLIVGLMRREAIDIGRTYDQHAIFEVTDEELVVLGCDETWEVRRSLDTTDFLATQRADGPAQDLAAAVNSTLGFTVVSSLVRFDYVGWEYEGSCGAVCRTCNCELELFGCTALSKSGTETRLTAFVCPVRHTLLWPHDVDASTRECAKLWRKFLFAQQEAAERGAKETYYAYVIELEGEVDARPVGSDAELPWVYVGQSAKAPVERLQQHLNGYKPSRWVKRHGSHLRPELFENHPLLRNRLAALAYEAWLAESLRNRGFPVKGGH
jgi:hypothetical protein